MTWNGCNTAHFPVLEDVDNAALANVGIPDKADADLLPVGMELGKLTEELDKGTFAKGMMSGGMKCQSRGHWGEM